ncbi:MAG: RNA methyltransferase substrate-binding domain-containing protein, partial [Vicinamibacterales bacterium]|nr:RNA methyltransferase substrate-binding domain-containing protein [Vicinamibacterales bacterium]
MIVYGLNPVLEALRAGRVRAIRLGAASSARASEVRRLAAAAGTPVTSVPMEVLDRATGGAVHQGVVAEVTQPASMTL